MSGLTKRGTPRKRAYPENRVSRNAPLYDRVLRYVREGEGGCWIWTAYIDEATGYGAMTINGKAGYKAHRVAFEAFRAEIPEGLHLDHLCRVRSCVNPWHLEPVTPLVNTRRGEGHGKETHCPQGHPYDEVNTYRRCGRRYCRTCQRERAAAYKLAKRVEPGRAA